MAIKVSGTTVIDDSRNLVNINSGLGVGIQSAGSAIGYGVTQLNFIGAGNTFKLSGNTIDISISGSGGGGGGSGVGATVGVATYSIYSNEASLASGNYTLSNNANYAAIGPFTIPDGTTVVVESGNQFVVI
jgi:hypothetical protein